MKKNLILGSAGTFTVRILQALTGFLASIILARLLGPAGMGYIATALAVISLCIIPVEAGMTKLAVRETARYFKTERENAIYSLKTWLKKRVTASTIGVLSALVILIESDLLSNVELAYACLLASIIPIRSFSLIYSGYLRGLNKPILGQIFELVRNITYLTILLSVFLFFPKVEILSVIVILVFSSAVGGLFVYMLAKRNVPSFQKGVKYAVHEEWTKSIFPFAALSGIAAVVAAMDVLIINAVSGPEEAGIFNVAAQVSALIAFGTTAILGVSGPHFSKLFFAGELHRLNHLVKRATQAAASISTAFLILIFFFSEQLVQAVFGSEFMPAAQIMKTLVFAQLITVFSAFSGSLLNMTGNEKRLMKVAVVAVLVKAIAAATLVPTFGAQGAAVSSICYALFLSMISGWMVYSKIGITPLLALLGLGKPKST